MSTKPITLQVANRPGKKPIKKLPSTIQIDATTTVEDAKIQIAKAAGVRDYNRVAIFDPKKQVILKDRNALLAQESAVMETQKIMVRDIGPQMSWRTVYIIEYAGPMLIHLLPLVVRPYVYSGVRASDSLSPVQNLAMAMLVAHFIKRELETLFIHKFSSSTMPLFNLFKNSGHYWFLAGINVAYWVFSPTAIAAKPLSDTFSMLCVYVGTVLYLFGEIANLYTHLVLSSLRSRGGTERGIPKGFGFNWVTCPNYLFEIISWIGICFVTRSFSTLLFTILGSIQMAIWAQGKEKRYRVDFGDKYKPNKYPLIPGIPYSGGKKSKK